MERLYSPQFSQLVNYWLAFDSFHIPEWQASDSKEGSFPSFDWSRRWSETMARFKEHEDEEDKNERDSKRKKQEYTRKHFALRMMAQCHTAAYLLPESKSYSRSIPKTYLASFLVIFRWDKDTQKLQLELSLEDQHFVFNRALFRKLFRHNPRAFKQLCIQKCLEDFEGNIKEQIQKLWIEQAEHFKEDSLNLDLHWFFRKINHVLALATWSDWKLKAFIRDHACDELVAQQASDHPFDYTIQNNLPLFSWRWLETHDQVDPEVMGPFFQKDLKMIHHLLQERKPLSPPLRAFLVPSEEASFIPKGAAPDKYQPYLEPEQMALSRWPTKTEYGLSLMQSIAVNQARQLTDQRPILAVNGPPGTGKTTLLKDLIADRFVARMFDLAQDSHRYNWFKVEQKNGVGMPKTILQSTLDHGFVVASSNNKAIENISRELPDLKDIDERYQQEMGYFRECIEHGKSDWGLFCAVLGKSKNRKIFIDSQLNPLKKHLKGLSDPYQLNYFSNRLNSSPQKSFSNFGEDWQKNRDLEGLLIELDDILPKLKASNRDIFAAFKDRLKQFQRDENWDAMGVWLKQLDSEERQSLCFGLKQCSKSLQDRKNERLETGYDKKRKHFLKCHQAVLDWQATAKRLGSLLDEQSRLEAKLQLLREKLQRTPAPKDPIHNHRSAYEQVKDLKANFEQAAFRREQQANSIQRLQIQVKEHQQVLHDYQKRSFGSRLLHYGLKMFGLGHQLETTLKQSEKQLDEQIAFADHLHHKVESHEGAYTKQVRFLPYYQLCIEMEDLAAQIVQVRDRCQQLSQELGLEPNEAEDCLMYSNAWKARENETELDERLQKSAPWSAKQFNHLRSQLFLAALAYNQALIELSPRTIAWALDSVDRFIQQKLPTEDQENKYWWSLFFLCFPVISTTFASVERQFANMDEATFGTLLVDEAGQALSYCAAGLLYRAKRAVIVGDPLQLEPVVKLDDALDNELFKESINPEYTSAMNPFKVSTASFQTLADRSSLLTGQIGEIKVGLPLRVHRRCSDPMFSIANQIAYDGQMIQAKKDDHSSLFSTSEWIPTKFDTTQKGRAYFNKGEIQKASELVRDLLQQGAKQNEIFIITPFRLMSTELKKHFKKTHGSDFSKNNIGTVHTFQGKEATVVILCMCCSKKNSGGVVFVNNKPNLLNVAVTRAKTRLFVIGDPHLWAKGQYSKVLLELLKGQSDLLNNQITLF